MKQRTEYMNGDCSHQEYYVQLADLAGICSIPDRIQAMSCRALASGDEHLNSISLGTWDNLARPLCHDPQVKEAFQMAGDFVTLAGMVCCLKALAIREAGVKSERLNIMVKLEEVGA